MAIRLPDRDYYTFPELIERWGCENNDIRRLIINRRLIPSYVISGEVANVVILHEELEDGRRIWVPREVENDVGDAELLEEIPFKRIWTHGFYYLVHPWQKAPLDCKFVLFSTNRNHAEPSGEPCLMLPRGKLSGRDLMLDDVMENGAVMKSEVELLERDLHGLPATADTQPASVPAPGGDIDPADLPDELSAANIAFRAVTNGFGDKTATFRNRLVDYLEKNFPSLNSEAVQRLATVANPDKSTGRKRRGEE